jgi:hypothetical protein
MFGNVLTLVGLKRVGQLLTGLAFAIVIAGSGNAADLPRRINARHSNAEFDRFLADRRQVPATSAEARKKLFDEFLSWRAARERR